jgi:hypothetical protein
LTKGPFNSLCPTSDLNNALLGFILGKYNGFSTAAGHIGHKYKVDHDISLLVPELWARLTPEEREPAFLIENGYLERIKDFDHKGKHIPAARLGWRITPLFASHFLGRIFDAPSAIFPEEVLRPEIQSLEYFADGILNIAEAQERVARDYLEDGSISAAIPPIVAILHIMAEGSWQGKGLENPELRQLFDRDYVLGSDWYRARLSAYADSERSRLASGVAYIEKFLDSPSGRDDREIVRARRELAAVKAKLADVSQGSYTSSLVGTIGLDPLYRG